MFSICVGGIQSMIPLISTPIPLSNVEICRDQIAIILKQNLDYQYTKHYNPEAEVEKVFIEASNPNDFIELSLVNVGIDTVPYSDKNYGGAVTASPVINVDVYVKSATSAGTKGDSASRKKCTRLLSICRYILEDPIYKTLGFEPGFIHGVSVESIGMADSEKYDTQNVSMGRLVFSVITNEDNALLLADTIEGQTTQVLVGTGYDGEEYGFKYVL